VDAGALSFEASSRIIVPSELIRNDGGIGLVPSALLPEAVDFCRLTSFPCSTARREGFNSQSEDRSRIAKLGERSPLTNCDFGMLESEDILQR